MNRIGILHHPRIPDAAPLAEEVAVWLREKEIEVWLDNSWDSDHFDQELPETALLLVIGGDGSMLKTAQMAAPFGVPVFCINKGRVGFLSGAEPTDWQEKLELILEGKYRLESRLLLASYLIRDGEKRPFTIALNDVVVGRGAEMRVVRCDLYIDDIFVTQYTADGLIVATPTGATAYAMAAHGPLLLPDMNNIIIVPIAPYLSLDRALVLPDTAQLRIDVQASHNAVLVLDGQTPYDLMNGDQIIVEKSAYPGYFIWADEPGKFYERLRTQLGIGSRKH